MFSSVLELSLTESFYAPYLVHSRVEKVNTQIVYQRRNRLKDLALHLSACFCSPRVNNNL